MREMLIGIAAVGLVPALGLFISGMQRLRHAKRLETDGVEIEGTVLGLSQKSRFWMGQDYFLMVEYIVDGAPRQQKFRIALKEIPELRELERITLLYEPAQPENACLKRHDLAARAKQDLNMAAVLAGAVVLVMAVMLVRAAF